MNLRGAARRSLIGIVVGERQDLIDACPQLSMIGGSRHVFAKLLHDVHRTRAHAAVWSEEPHTCYDIYGPFLRTWQKAASASSSAGRESTAGRRGSQLF